MYVTHTTDPIQPPGGARIDPIQPPGGARGAEPIHSAGGA